MQARRLPASHGLLWLAGAFRLFRVNPPAMSALTLAWYLTYILATRVTLIGPIALSFALPSLSLILANACRALDQGQRSPFAALGNGLLDHRRAFLRLGALHLSCWLVVATIAYLLLPAGAAEALQGSGSEADEVEALTALGLLMIMATPAVAAFWFAPMLVGWEGVPALKAVFFSFIAALRNWRAFFSYMGWALVIAAAFPGVVLLVAGLVDKGLVPHLASVLRMVMLLVFAPVFAASVYVSYKDVFVERQ